MHLQKVIFQQNLFPDTENYPYNLEIINSISEIEFTHPVTFFTGENGCGKTTILKAIAMNCGIYIWEFSERPRYNYNQYEDSLSNLIKAVWKDEVVAGSFFDARNFEYFTKLLDEWAITDPGQLNYFGGKSLVAQSHGQSLMSFFRSRYGIKGIYFLDEPETALSPKSQIDLLKLITKFSEEGYAQFIIATHSPIIMSVKGATIYNFDQNRLKTIEYLKTDHYTVFRDFILSIEGNQI
jgi:predicted ATPase